MTLYMPIQIIQGHTYLLYIGFPVYTHISGTRIDDHIHVFLWLCHSLNAVYTVHTNKMGISGRILQGLRKPAKITSKR